MYTLVSFTQFVNGAMAKNSYLSAANLLVADQ